MHLRASDGPNHPQRRKTDKAPAIASRALLTLIILLTGSASIFTLFNQANDAGNNTERDQARVYQRCLQSRADQLADNRKQTDILNGTYDAYLRITTVLGDPRLNKDVRKLFTRSARLAKDRYEGQLNAIENATLRTTALRQLERNGVLESTVVFVSPINCDATYPGGREASKQYPDEAPKDPAPVADDAADPPLD